MNKNGHEKTYAVLIICIAAVVSAFVLVKNPKLEIKSANTGTLSYSKEDASARELINNNDWSKILVKAVPNEKIGSPSKTSASPDQFDASLATARMARDIFSRYLEVAKNGQTVSDQDITKIVDDTLSTPDYSKVNSVVYVLSNLSLNNENNTAGYKKYGLAFNQKLFNRMSEVRNVNDPATIMLRVANSDNRKLLGDMDVIVSANRGLINDLLKISTPSSMAQMHLQVINAASSLLSDIEAMKNIYVDPVASLAATSQFNKHMSDLIESLRKIDDFLKKN